MTTPDHLPPLPLPTGIRTRFVDNGNGLTMHVLEAGTDSSESPCVLLLHGFPELAYSWRKIMPALADAGFYVIAPDQRGYGRTTGWNGNYDGDLEPFRFLNLVTDAVGLLHALGRRSVDAVIGHDFGSPVAGCCALIRPDVFRSVVMMSAPFAGPPALPFGTAGGAKPRPAPPEDVHTAMATLNPPRKHYQWYYSEREADGDMLHAAQGLHDFLRAYYHFKSADWLDNQPHPLQAWSATELAKLPTYYVMHLNETMAETVVPAMPSAEHIAACTWLPDAELAVYTAEYTRTGFQGGLNWYRCVTSGRNGADLSLFSGRTIDVPASFFSGRADWGTYQRAGDLETLESSLCAHYQGTRLIDGAGHWVQQEQPEAVIRHLLDFLRK